MDNRIPESANWPLATYQYQIALPGSYWYVAGSTRCRHNDYLLFDDTINPEFTTSDGGGVIQWCEDQVAAIQHLRNLQNYPEFSELTIGYLDEKVGFQDFTVEFDATGNILSILSESISENKEK